MEKIQYGTNSEGKRHARIAIKYKDRRFYKLKVEDRRIRTDSRIKMDRRMLVAEGRLKEKSNNEL